jgi:hypothetical protein
MLGAKQKSSYRAGHEELPVSKRVMVLSMLRERSRHAVHRRDRGRVDKHGHENCLRTPASIGARKMRVAGHPDRKAISGRRAFRLGMGVAGASKNETDFRGAENTARFLSLRAESATEERRKPVFYRRKSLTSQGVWLGPIKRPFQPNWLVGKQ